MVFAASQSIGMKENPTMPGTKTVQNLKAMAGMMPLVNMRNSGSARSLQ
jgi:hypothetical protein